MSLFLGFIPMATYANPKLEKTELDNNPLVSFNVKPSRCIALRKGQTCYQKLQFSWEIRDTDFELDSAIARSYCLVQKGDERPLVCWENNELSQYKFEFKSANKVEYAIVRENNQLGKLEVNVSWVYKTQKSRGGDWRMF